MGHASKQPRLAPRWSSAHERRRHVALAMLLLALLTGCARSPAPRPDKPARISDTRGRTSNAASAPAPAKTPPAPRLEETAAGEASGLTPPPKVTETALAPTPEVVAALPKAEQEPAQAPATAAEPESMLTHIGPTTPPNVAAALRLIEDGRQRMRRDGADRALDRLERAVAIDPTNTYGYYFLAQVHYVKKDYDQAIAFASRAVVLCRHDPIWLGRIYSLQGAVFEEAGRYPDARKAYQQAMHADPNNLAARVGMARLAPE